MNIGRRKLNIKSVQLCCFEYPKWQNMCQKNLPDLYLDSMRNFGKKPRLFGWPLSLLSTFSRSQTPDFYCLPLLFCHLMHIFSNVEDFLLKTVFTRKFSSFFSGEGLYNLVAKPTSSGCNWGGGILDVFFAGMGKCVAAKNGLVSYKLQSFYVFLTIHSSKIRPSDGASGEGSKNSLEKGTKKIPRTGSSKNWGLLSFQKTMAFVKLYQFAYGAMRRKIFSLVVELEIDAFFYHFYLFCYSLFFQPTPCLTPSFSHPSQIDVKISK